MVRYVVLGIASVIAFLQPLRAETIPVSELVDKCAMTLDKFHSWTLNCEIVSEIQSRTQKNEKRIACYDLGLMEREHLTAPTDGKKALSCKIISLTKTKPTI